MNLPSIDHLDIEPLRLSLIRYGMDMGMSEMELANLKVDVWNEYNLEFKRIMYRITTQIWGEKRNETLIIPATWWQMFKEQYFPKWLLKHFPVEYYDMSFAILTKFPEYNYPPEFGKPRIDIFRGKWDEDGALEEDV